ncbi:hypothetical protein H2200_000581 [Cladophialophora chaetospira]|uniref:Uncharacterized protein n=1 Tax=Cladophialophora chaetospira TaxID=386627 RepID=A0AA38XP21_9EURO|nr:hypothetical protein H2200_000581 [Cladophialophora chaetospira]
MRSLRIATLNPRRPSTIRAVIPSYRLLIRSQSNTPVGSQEPPPSRSKSESQQLVQDKKSAQQNRTSIDRQSYEYSGSATDDAAAAQSSSYDPSKTNNPHESIAHATEETHNTLEVSPANREVSASTSEVEGISTSDGKQVTETQTQTQTSIGKSDHTKSSKSTLSATSQKKKIFAGSDKRKEARPGAETDEVELAKGKAPIHRAGPR